MEASKLIKKSVSYSALSQGALENDRRRNRSSGYRDPQDGANVERRDRIRDRGPSQVVNRTTRSFSLHMPNPNVTVVGNRVLYLPSSASSVTPSGIGSSFASTTTTTPLTAQITRRRFSDVGVGLSMGAVVESSHDRMTTDTSSISNNNTYDYFVPLDASNSNELSVHATAAAPHPAPYMDGDGGNSLPSSTQQSSQQPQQQHIIHTRSDSVEDSSADGSSTNNNPDATSDNTTGQTKAKANESRSINVDGDRVYRATREAGSHAMGVVGVDVWTLGPGNCFVHAATWICPTFRQRQEALPESSQAEALDRLLDPHHPSYEAPVPQVPGAGLAGYFWALGAGASVGEGGHDYPPLYWRQLRAITSDPLQPPYSRMKVIEEAGLGLATGVPFHAGSDVAGVVVYLVQGGGGGADESMLNEPANVHYLHAAAHHIGSALAMSVPRQWVAETKARRMSSVLRRVRVKLMCLFRVYRLYRTLSHHDRRLYHRERHFKKKDDDEYAYRYPQDYGRTHRPLWLCWWCCCCSTSTTVPFKIPFQQSNHYPHPSLKVDNHDVAPFLLRRTRLFLEKARGSSHLKPAPASSLSHAAWAFVGVLTTLAMLMSLSSVAERQWGCEAMVLPPFGALLTLQFDLTAAPVSQPRNVIYGQLLSVSVALLFQDLFHTRLNWSVDVVVCLALATGISLSALIGTTHPPAAAAIVALYERARSTSRPFSVQACALLLAGNAVAVIMAIAVNNWSDQRQYPLYYAFGFGVVDTIHYRLLSMVRSCLGGLVRYLDSHLGSMKHAGAPDNNFDLPLAKNIGDDDERSGPTTAPSSSSTTNKPFRRVNSHSGFTSIYRLGGSYNNENPMDSSPLLMPAPPTRQRAQMVEYADAYRRPTAYYKESQSPPLRLTTTTITPHLSHRQAQSYHSSLGSLDSDHLPMSISSRAGVTIGSGAGVDDGGKKEDFGDNTSAPILNDCLVDFLEHGGTAASWNSGPTAIRRVQSQYNIM